MTIVRAVAHANIALAKYWGKANVAENLPSVPSLSMTLDALSTTTEVRFGIDADDDEVIVDGRAAAGRPRDRVVEMLDRVRRAASTDASARVISANDFPTASGLASSASGFAALALASTRAAGLDWTLAEVSDLARASSASAARSVYGGYVSLKAGGHSAERVASGEDLPLVLLVAVTSSEPKAVGSTAAMQHTAETSPYYEAWVARAPALYGEIHAAVLSGDLTALGSAMEQSALMMHASMLAARPAVAYFSPATVAVMTRVRRLREEGIEAFFTIDAGPHVKVLTRPELAGAAERALSAVPGVQRVIRCRPGPDAYIEAPCR